MLPLVLFFLAYIILKLFLFSDAVALSLGAIGFLCGVCFALFKNKKLSKTNILNTEIVSFSE